jgi:hypothetical protein
MQLNVSNLEPQLQVPYFSYALLETVKKSPALHPSTLLHESYSAADSDGHEPNGWIEPTV